jgi:hypothetical protein
MDLKEVGWDGVDGIRLTRDTDKGWAAVNTAMNLQVL